MRFQHTLDFILQETRNVKSVMGVGMATGLISSLVFYSVYPVEAEEIGRLIDNTGNFMLAGAVFGAGVGAFNKILYFLAEYYSTRSRGCR
ncbi:hypothetical protein HYX07_03635 [Candidatus Woesearchaeota archaeon]|nr:hypothetical protein [Candidatus Woesearchaeota archaeon]